MWHQRRCSTLRMGYLYLHTVSNRLTFLQAMMGLWKQILIDKARAPAASSQRAPGGIHPRPCLTRKAIWLLQAVRSWNSSS